MLLCPHFAWIAQLVEHFPEEEGVPSSSLGPSTRSSRAILKRMFGRFFAWVQKYERHLSAIAMVAGFVADNLLFERVDLLQTQVLLAAYTATCFISIPLLHFFETRPTAPPRWRFLLPLATQFALGGFWSAFVIFYGRSADFGVSWPFLLFLLGVLLANEYFHRYHDRVVFTCVLFFFALYSYAIFELPLLTGTISTRTFFESGLIAILVFFLFMRLLKLVARARFMSDIWRIRFGAGVVFILMNIFYFTNILPPLPLAASSAGIYHNVWRVPGQYLGTTEAEPWQVRYLGFPPTLHVTSGESLSAYSSVFAPTTLTTPVVHHWQWYDPTAKKWVEKAQISYPIIGGRGEGYRGYSTVQVAQAGEWRVRVETVDHRVIVDLPFTAVLVSTEPTLETLTLP
jgi:hypothetical protein